MNEVIVKFKEVSKVFGHKKALSHLSFEVFKGEILAFLGPNGAGKTTVVKLLTRLYDPQSGVIRLDGTDIREFETFTHCRIANVFMGFMKHHFRRGWQQNSPSFFQITTPRQVLMWWLAPTIWTLLHRAWCELIHKFWRREFDLRLPVFVVVFKRIGLEPV